MCRLEIVTREDKLRQCGRCEGMGANMGAKDGRGDCGARQYHRARSKPPPRSTKACAMSSPAAAKPTMLKTHGFHMSCNTRKSITVTEQCVVSEWGLFTR